MYVHDPLKLVPRAWRRGIIGDRSCSDRVETFGEKFVFDERGEEPSQFNDNILSVSAEHARRRISVCLQGAADCFQLSKEGRIERRGRGQNLHLSSRDILFRNTGHAEAGFARIGAHAGMIFWRDPNGDCLGPCGLLMCAVSWQNDSLSIWLACLARPGRGTGNERSGFHV
jgi:hypothetical protein